VAVTRGWKEIYFLIEDGDCVKEMMFLLSFRILDVRRGLLERVTVVNVRVVEVWRL